jgi:hypothetical protein
VTRRRWLNHATVQVLLLPLPLAALLSFTGGLILVGCFLMVLVFLLWVWTLGWHAVITGGQKNMWRALRYTRRCASRHFGKACSLVACRLTLLMLAVFNLHLFGLALVWIGDQLAGLDVGALYLVMSLGNPVYLLALGALAWWLLAPYHEAVNFLFYMDARTRYEGVDLWYRIEQFFPTKAISQAGAILLALGIALWSASPAVAQTASKLKSVQKARQQVADVLQQAKAANPYPGGQEWGRQLRRIGKELDPDSDAQAGRYQWFFKAADKLGTGDRAQDEKILKEVEDRLLVVEKSLMKPAGSATDKTMSADQIKQLVPPWHKSEKYQTTEPKKKDKKPPDKDNEPPQIDQGPGPVPKVGVAPPVQVGAGAGTAALYFLIAVMVVVLVAGLVLALVNWLRHRKPKVPLAQGQLGPQAPEEHLENPDQQDVHSLWQRADELALAGRYLEALRTLYLGVLALLHQAHLIRYERTRTNGEYADQLRNQPHLHPLFLDLTMIFDLKWYGERACAEQDYATCRQIAVQIEQQARNHL